MSKRGQMILLWMFLIMFVSAHQLFSNPIQVYTREGNDATDSSSISTDHIHIIVPDFHSYTSASYKLYEGAEDSLSWGSIPSFEFYQDLYFYKQAFNQYIQISLTDTAGQLIEKQIILRGGELDGHTDDPILPVDLVARMGNGLIVEADVDKADVDPEYDVIALKKAGIGHIRMHIGRLDKTKELIHSTLYR